MPKPYSIIITIADSFSQEQECEIFRCANKEIADYIHKQLEDILSTSPSFKRNHWNCIVEMGEGDVGVGKKITEFIQAQGNTTSFFTHLDHTKYAYWLSLEQPTEYEDFEPPFIHSIQQIKPYEIQTQQME